MAQERLPALPALAVPDAADLVYVVDVDDATDHATGSSKKSTIGSLPVTEAQIAGANFSNWNSAYSWGDHALVGYLTAEQNDLSVAVSWVDIPAGNVPALAVTQHEAALTILETQITDGAILGRVAADEAVTGLWNFKKSGAGGLTDYDVTVGDTDGTPTYGIARIGNATFGRTSFNSGSLDLDGAVLLWNNAAPATSNIEFAYADGSNNIRFALAKSGAGNATYNPRSMLIAGPAILNDEIVTVGYWQTNNDIFHHLACDTSGDGADLGVQNDLEVMGEIFADRLPAMESLNYFMAD